MNTKMCNKCNQVKTIVGFNKKGNSTQSYCKECTRAQIREHYRNNKQYYVDKSERRKQELQALIRQLKAVPCCDCGNEYPYYVMDFDHLSDKEFLVSRMAKLGNKRKILEEASKCDVVCANCHRIRTFTRSN